MSQNLSQGDIDYIREGYRLFTEGNPAFLERYEPDAVLDFPESLPKGGTYASPWDAMEFWSHMGELFEDPRPEPEELLRDGDRLVVLGRFHGRSRTTGEQVAIRFAHVFGLTGAEGPMSERRFASLEVIADTAALLAAVGHAGED